MKHTLTIIKKVSRYNIFPYAFYLDGNIMGLINYKQEEYDFIKPILSSKNLAMLNLKINDTVISQLCEWVLNDELEVIDKTI
jgi:hypothetical protein